MGWASGLQERTPAHPVPSLWTIPSIVWLQALDKLQEAKAEDIQVTSELSLLVGTTPMSCLVLDVGTDPASPSSLVISGGALSLPSAQVPKGPCLEAQACSVLSLPLLSYQAGMGPGMTKERGLRARGLAPWILEEALS